MGRRGRASIAACVLVALLAGCGDDGNRYGDQRIVESLNLREEPGGGGYVIGNNLFCEVKDLLNDSDEVGDAVDEDEVVVASGEGNVGVTGTGAFGHHCAVKARKGLNELDPPPKDE